jgi:hypothetical protein
LLDWYARADQADAEDYKRKEAAKRSLERLASSVGLAPDDVLAVSFDWTMGEGTLTVKLTNEGLMKLIARMRED